MRRPVRDRAAKLMRSRKWSYEKPSNGLRARLYALVVAHHPWWDWGHYLMILTGTDFGGNWSEPEPPTWWYHRVGKKQMWRTGYPRDRFQIIKGDYEEFRRLTEGLNEDRMYEWKAVGFDQDGQLFLGHRYWGGDFYGLPQDEVAIVRRYLRMAHRHGWFGLRHWLYSQALHAAVYRHKPGSCRATPPKGQGGYDHWFCQLKRRHDGMHRFNNYVWGDIGGEPVGALYDPQEARISGR